jgi:hypothetical protein
MGYRDILRFLSSNMSLGLSGLVGVDLPNSTELIAGSLKLYVLLLYLTTLS